MGTRCLTVFEDERHNEIAVLYRQFDGYPEGHGKELFEYLDGKRLVNGIGMGDDTNAFNGMECLAASTVAHFKDGIGGFYLYPAKTRGMGEEYVYTVKPGNGGKIKIETKEAS